MLHNIDTGRALSSATHTKRNNDVQRISNAEAGSTILPPDSSSGLWKATDRHRYTLVKPCWLANRASPWPANCYSQTDANSVSLMQTWTKRNKAITHKQYQQQLTLRNPDKPNISVSLVDCCLLKIVGSQAVRSVYLKTEVFRSQPNFSIKQHTTLDSNC